jgi:hypothetical protein
MIPITHGSSEENCVAYTIKLSDTTAELFHMLSRIIVDEENCSSCLGLLFKQLSEF